MDDDFGSFDFMIGFNDATFSDRVLIIEIIADDATHSAETGVGCSEECCSRVIKLNVCSLLLAARSSFFHKLFTNGMKESEQKWVTLRIHASEETAIMELLHYMYSGTLTVRTAPALLDVLKLADKFQVVPCMRLCTSLLTKLPMSTESALLYLDLTSSLPLADAAKQYLTTRYKHIHEVWDEIMKLPLAGIEAILSSDVLGVVSEDHMFELALEWTETHYPKPDDQRKILSTHLGQYIRFPYMSLEKLREVLSCKILDDGFAYKVVIDALFFKITTRFHHHKAIAAVEGSNYYRPRTYYQRLIKVLEFEFPCQDVVVYFDLTFDGCANLYPSNQILTESFNLGTHPFHFYVNAFGYEERSSCFTVCLDSDLHNYEPFAIDYEFAARSKCAKKFVLKKSGSLKFLAGSEVTLYETPWLDFKAGKILDFIDGIVYLEVKLRRIMQ